MEDTFRIFQNQPFMAARMTEALKYAFRDSVRIPVNQGTDKWIRGILNLAYSEPYIPGRKPAHKRGLEKPAADRLLSGLATAFVQRLRPWHMSSWYALAWTMKNLT